jgi:hypothetical protein
MLSHIPPSIGTISEAGGGIFAFRKKTIRIKKGHRHRWQLAIKFKRKWRKIDDLFQLFLGDEKKCFNFKGNDNNKKIPLAIKSQKTRKKKEIKYARTHPVHPEKMWVDIKFSHTFSLKKKNYHNSTLNFLFFFPIFSS